MHLQGNGYKAIRRNSACIQPPFQQLGLNLQENQVHQAVFERESNSDLEKRLRFSI